MLNRSKCVAAVAETAARNYVSCNGIKPCRSLRIRPLSDVSSRNQRSSQSQSIFSNREASWDNIFSDVKDTPPSSLSTTHDSRATSSRQSPRPRQSMTARETSAFNQMFQMIFDAVAAQEKGSASTSTGDSAIGVGRGGVDDLIGRLRKYPRKLKLSAEVDGILDRQKEAMDLCTTDQELLLWASREVFGESQRYEEEAREAMLKVVEPGVASELPMLQPPAYPHLIALLVRTFRDRYKDPHLALSIFDHAQHLSIASYVFGCSTQAYNELIETRWKCFYDMKGVLDALEEMKVNGVKTDSRTRTLVDLIRRDIGERNLQVGEFEFGENEAWGMLAEIEKLASTSAQKKWVRPSAAKHQKGWDIWKTSPLEDHEDDSWGFNRWDKPGSNKNGRDNTSLRSSSQLA